MKTFASLGPYITHQLSSNALQTVASKFVLFFFNTVPNSSSWRQKTNDQIIIQFIVPTIQVKNTYDVCSWSNYLVVSTPLSTTYFRGVHKLIDPRKNVWWIRSLGHHVAVRQDHQINFLGHVTTICLSNSNCL